jgi:ABC-type multidrug transport system fused ATPase/permease subunit
VSKVPDLTWAVFSDLFRLSRYVTAGNGRSLLVVLPVLMTFRGVIEAFSLSAIVILVVSVSQTGSEPSGLLAAVFAVLPSGQGQSPPLLLLTGLVLLLLVVKSGYYGLISWMRAVMAQRWIPLLSLRLYQMQIACPRAGQEMPDPVVAAGQATDSSSCAVNNYLLAALDAVGEALLIGVLLLLFAWVMSPWAPLVLLGPGVLGGIAYRALNRRAQQRSGIRKARTHQLRRLLLDSHQCRREIHAYRRRAAFGQRFRFLADDFSRAVAQQQLAQDMLPLITEGIGVIGVLALVAFDSALGTADPVRLLAGLTICVRLLPSIRRLAVSLHAVNSYHGDAAGILNVLDAYASPSSHDPMDRAEAPLAYPDGFGGNFKQVQSRLSGRGASAAAIVMQVEQVDFAHPPSDGNSSAGSMLHAVSFAIKAGEWVAVMGPSGAGKSTLIELVLGRLRPQAGRVSPDPATMSGLGYLGPSACLLDATLRDNLAFPSGQYLDDADAHRILAIAQATEIISKFPLGLDQPMGSMEAMLSHGEKQRIGLARAILQAKHLLILDEATAALDVSIEQRLFQSLRQSMPELAVLFVTHRAATACHADRLFRLEGGSLYNAPLSVGDL